MRTRKNVKTLTQTEKINFVNAVLALKNKPSIVHPGNTGFGRYDDYVEVLRDSAQAHSGPAFLPWNRAFVLQFENDLASVNPHVSLPYWDWTDQGPGANPLTADFLGGNGAGGDQLVVDGPFAEGRWKLNIKEDPGDCSSLQRDLGADPTAPAPPTLGLQNGVLNLGTYDCSPWKGVTNTFRWQCETALHQLTIRFVGGTMETTASANDPLYFLHAANIDRLYAVWQGLHQASAHYLPVASAPTGQNLDDPLIFNRTGLAPFCPTATPASVLHHRALGYQFDTETHAALGTLKIPCGHLQILFGILNNAPAATIAPGGNLISVPGGQIPIGPGDPWTQLSPAARDTLIGSAMNELAAQFGNSTARKQAQSVVLELTHSKMRAASS